MVPGLALLSVQRRWLAAALGAAVVAILVITLVIRPWSAAPDPTKEVAAPEPGDRVIQSVNLAMQDDGSLATINDTVVISRAQGGGADTLSASYDPSKVIDDLPVRVLTSYRTNTSSGTRLGDLKGYTGRVRIDLTVQNLTVEPQQVQYDVAGRSRTVTAMVGAPLTVVASAALSGVNSSKVVTSAEDAGANGESTNGVLSQAQDTTTQVQWATILAPPQLGSTATLRLVVDATDFTLPTFDLSVQPGLVTDPSLGALVDAAFNPKESGELALQSRTIKLIGDVNGVLGRASSTISKVRSTLDSTSKTLGSKTVSDLKTDTKNVTASVKTSRENLQALDKELGSALEATNSATLSQMEESVSQLNTLLGDTSAPVTPPKVTGTGCEQTVAAPNTKTSVYANLMQVSAQLDGYAAATGECKKELQGVILANIGPANPTEEACAESESVTCSLAEIELTFADVSEQIAAGQTASAGIDLRRLAPPDPDDEDACTRPEPDPDPEPEPVTCSIDRLLTQLTEIKEDSQALTASTTEKLDEITSTLSNASTSLTDLSTAVDSVHQDALAGFHETGKNEDTEPEAGSMLAQNTDLADQLCDVAGTGAEPGKLTAVQVEQLRSYLVTQSCPDPVTGVTVPLVPPAAYGAAMETRLTSQAATFTKIATETDTTDESQGIGLRISQLSDQLTAVGTDVDHTRDALNAGQDALQVKMAGLRGSVDQAEEGLEGLRESVLAVQETYAEAKTQLDAALEEASQGVDESSTSLDPTIKRISDQGQADSEQVGEMFERSAAGLTAASDAIQKDSASTVKKQQADLVTSQAGAGKTLTAGTEEALKQVSREVTVATRNLDATKTLLTRDLNNVLLDLGDPKIPGKGVIGSLAKGATAAGSADYQLGLATDKTSAYAAVRGRDVNGILLRQAQAEASLQRQADLPAFVRPLPDTTTHRTVYVFHLAGGR